MKDVDLMSHDELCAALNSVLDLATAAIAKEAAQRINYFVAQDGLLTQAQDEAQKLREELAEVKRPLDEQMARLNANLTAANARIAQLTMQVADSPLGAAK